MTLCQASGTWTAVAGTCRQAVYDANPPLTLPLPWVLQDGAALCLKGRFIGYQRFSLNLLNDVGDYLPHIDFR